MAVNHHLSRDIIMLLVIYSFKHILNDSSDTPDVSSVASGGVNMKFGQGSRCSGVTTFI